MSIFDGNIYERDVPVPKQVNPWAFVYAEIDEAEEKAKRGDVDAMNRVARLYNNQANFSAALSWYEKAAAAGSAEGMCSIGDWHSNHDKTAALDWYRKAAALGHEGALEKVADYDEAINKLSEIAGKSAASLKLTWSSEGEIAAILAKRFPQVDAFALDDQKLFSMMSEVGLIRILPSLGRPGENKDTLFAIKCALAQIIRGDIETERAAILSDISSAGEKIEAGGWIFYINPARTSLCKARPDGSVCMPIPPPEGTTAANYRNLRLLIEIVQYDCDIEYLETKRQDTETLAIGPSGSQATYGLS
jgi:tetratricopeptide (TPR) repeat protein